MVGCGLVLTRLLAKYRTIRMFCSRLQKERTPERLQANTDICACWWCMRSCASAWHTATPKTVDFRSTRRLSTVSGESQTPRGHNSWNVNLRSFRHRRWCMQRPSFGTEAGMQHHLQSAHVAPLHLRSVRYFVPANNCTSFSGLFE